MLLDTTHEIATPEGVELRLPLAGLGARSLAWLVDAFIKLIGLTIASVITGLLGGFGTGLMLITAFAALWLYNVLFEVLNQGATPGKRMLKLRVMNSNGTPVGWTGSVIRNLIRFIDALPGVYLIGCVAVLVSKRFQRLGDLAADTIVVHQSAPTAPVSGNQATPVPLRIPLSLEEQQAIVSYGERLPQISRDRGEELAAILSPVLQQVDADQLQSHAKWLVRGGDA